MDRCLGGGDIDWCRPEAQGAGEEGPRRRVAPRGDNQHVDDLSVLVDGAVQVLPAAGDLHVGVGSSTNQRPRGEWRAARAASMNSGVKVCTHGDVIGGDAAFCQQFFHVAVGQAVAQLPAHRDRDHLTGNRYPAGAEDVFRLDTITRHSLLGAQPPAQRISAQSAHRQSGDPRRYATEPWWASLTVAARAGGSAVLMRWVLLGHELPNRCLQRAWDCAESRTVAGRRRCIGDDQSEDDEVLAGLLRRNLLRERHQVGRCGEGRIIGRPFRADRRPHLPEDPHLRGVRRQVPQSASHVLALAPHPGAEFAPTRIVQGQRSHRVLHGAQSAGRLPGPLPKPARRRALTAA